jgi:hypothetical protein
MKPHADADDLEAGVRPLPCHLLTTGAEPDDGGGELHRL